MKTLFLFFEFHGFTSTFFVVYTPKIKSVKEQRQNRKKKNVSPSFNPTYQYLPGPRGNVNLVTF